MNLDDFPTDETALDMMDMVTPLYDKSYIAKWIYEVMGEEISMTKELFEQLREQIFYETATWGLKYHEQKYGIDVNGNLSDEKRRDRIRLKRAYRAPINPEKIRIYVKEATGCLTTVHENYYAQIIINVWYSDQEPMVDIESLEKSICEMRPAHIAFQLNYLKENMWKLDGSFLLDGSRLLNAGENIKEEIDNGKYSD